MMKLRLSVILLAGFLLIPNIKAINLVDTLQQRLDTYNLEKPVISLYVHLDRNIYSPEDTIWFKAYVLTPILNEVLYVRISDRNKNKVLEKQFPMYDIRAHGDIMLPDTLPEGKYYFYAYTDRMISLNPNDVFVQPIIVSKNIMNRMEAEASVTNQKKIHRGEKVEILARVKGTAGKILKGKFSLWVGEQLLKKGSLSTNSLGEAYVRFTYPKIEKTEMVRCEIRFTQDKDFAELILNLRHEGNTVKVNTYAEGGHFLEGLPNRTIIEVLDDQKNPLEVPVELLEDHKIIGRTHTDKQGLGDIRFIPRANARYQWMVYENDTTTLLEFPGKIEPKGYGLRIETVKNRPIAVLTNRDQKDSATLVLRTKDQMVWSQSLSIRNGDSVRVELPIDSLSKGILNLAVFDTIAAPKAERYFLSKTEDPYKVLFSTVKSVKKGQATIKVSLNIVDSNNHPIATNFSISIVDKNTLNKNSYRTMLQSYYFNNMFGPRTSILDEHENAFDKRLISMNWELKSWGNMLRYQPTGFIRILENAGGISGVVTSKNKKPIKLEQLMLESTTLADKKDLTPLLNLFQGASRPRNAYNINKIAYTVKDWSEAVPLSKNGSFSISPKSLLVKPNEIKMLKPGLHFSDDYDIQMVDYSLEMDKYVRLGESLNFTQPVNTFTKYEAPVLNALSKIIQLKEVFVESKSGVNDNDDNMGKKEDYVCREYNVFNCPNHRTGGKKPIVGMIYATKERGSPIVFNGVGKPFSAAPKGAVVGTIDYIPIKNISRPNIFYNSASTDTSFLNTETRTTIFWAPNMYTDTNGKTTFDCNTSDRNGEFTIIVQGIEIKTLRPFYGTYDFKL
ncbi:MAG TPA: hypothetical protein VFP20_04945 [Bacteroidales bacterium]|nr:hypothetical protein [Bacteroidales bacterium]